MDKITGFRFTSLPADAFDAKSLRMYYTRNGVERKWDLIKVPDTVVMIILNKTRNTLVMVQKFQPGNPTKSQKTLKQSLVLKMTIFSRIVLFVTVMYHALISKDPNFEISSPESLLEKYPVSEAITHELCGGTVDKSKPIIHIINEKILEQCGYNVPVDRIELVMTYR